MGVSNSPDIFQENISKLFEGFYIVLVVNKHFLEHLQDPEKVIETHRSGNKGKHVNVILWTHIN